MTFLMDHTRHADIFNARSAMITLIGAGGIGSFTAIVLGKMGVGDLYIVDDDIIEDVNIATQLLRPADIKRSKAETVSYLVEVFGGQADWLNSRINAHYNPKEINNQIIISGVDSIDARKDIWQVVKQTNAEWYLDARMAAEEFHLFCVEMNDCGWYEDALSQLDEGSVPDLPCTMKATIYCGALAAAHIGAAVRKIITGITPSRYLVHNILKDTLVKV
jgi:molybdopterin/thiamine biosynthesis adenylyltransferase